LIANALSYEAIASSYLLKSPSTMPHSDRKYADARQTNQYSNIGWVKCFQRKKRSSSFIGMFAFHSQLSVLLFHFSEFALKHFLSGFIRVLAIKSH